MCDGYLGSRSPSALAVPNQQSDKPVIKNPEASRVLSPPAKSIFSPTEQHSIARKPKYAITSSVQTSSFTAMAVMLGYSIQKHNDLKAMDAELILLVRDDGPDAVTAANKTRLEKAGWKIRVAQDLEFEGVDTSQIRAHHRHNLNKLHLWSWTEYEKILFVDADVVCKGSVAELWSMPGDFAAAPDVWFDILVDTRFNSGVILFTPSMETFHNMISKVPDPKYHSPNDADQAFLNAYYKFRFFGLPFKYNFNLVMVNTVLLILFVVNNTDRRSINTTGKPGMISGTRQFSYISLCTSPETPSIATRVATNGSLSSGTANTSKRCSHFTGGRKSCR